jgi:hypothetical protein
MAGTFLADKNADSGLIAVSTGTITAQNVTAEHSGSYYGIWLDNCLSYTAVPSGVFEK